MTAYAPPLEDMRFALAHAAGLDGIAALPGYEEATPDLVDAALEEAGKLAAEVFAPLNQPGDRQGAMLENGAVRLPDGFREAYRQLAGNGWTAIPFDPGYGGQGLPWAVAMAVQEMWHAANFSLGVCPLLTQGATELLQAHGSEELKRLYLPRMIAGEWTGTMALTEPQAGSDLAQVRARAVPDGDAGAGAHRLFGQKIYITYGDHDLTENIVHMVLARLPGAPAGTRGISLFLVPKVVPGGDGGGGGEGGRRNDVRCVALEHKLGMHASPTATLAFGDDGGAVGYLLGRPHEGLRAMFTMMNNARLAVGLQGVGLAERAYQQARAYARERVQGNDLEGRGPVPIVRHPDIRRLLMTMRVLAEAGRALIYHAVGAHDRARRHPDEPARKEAQARVDLLTPVAKAWCTDAGVEAASLGIQVHGGSGYVEETGAAQHLRDARVTPIYEGSNGIQAADLAFRKVGRDGGAAARALIAEMRRLDDALAAAPGADLAAIRRRLGDGVAAFDAATGWVARTAAADPPAVAAGAGHYLRLAGLVAGGWLMAKGAHAAARQAADGAAFPCGKIAGARFFCDQLLPQAGALLATLTEGHESVGALADDEV
jgi:alkylation response protein AidB-like acyl-CoA dehydrogenase